MHQDLRLAGRMLRKQPGFTAVAVLTLALGIGATAAVVSLVRGVLLTPPPYRDPSRLVLVPVARADGQPMQQPRGWPSAQWTGWQEHSKSFESLGVYTWTFNFLVRNDGSESMEGLWVTRGYFRTLGLRPILGRTFLESETGDKPAPVIVLGYDMWQRKFNGDPRIVGQKIRISRQETPSEVIGVMPQGVRFLPSPTASQEPNYNLNAHVDFWIPAPSNPSFRKDPMWNIVGRLRDGVSPAQAQGELKVLAAQESRQEHDFEGFTPEVRTMTAELNHDGARILLPLLGASALVLLIACGNAAALLLVRGLQRQQEYAVRSALGVGRVALFRQVASESLMLGLLGSVLGVALAVVAVRVFKVIGGHAIPRLDAVSTGWPVLALGLIAAAIAALLAGVLPAFRASRLDPIQALKSAGPKSSAGQGERRLLRGVTLVQTALTLALLVGAGLLIRTMVNIANVQSGYGMSRILTMSVTAVEGNWNDYHHRALERVAAIPGVQYAAFAWGVPLTGNDWPVSLDIEGQPPPMKASDRFSIPLRAATEDYFKILGLPVIEGRGFRATDTNDGPGVAVVNQAFVDRFFPHQQAIGKKFWFDSRDKPGIQFVGVIANGRTDDLTKSSGPEIYMPLWQAHAFSKHLVVRTTADPHTVMAAVRRELHAVNPAVAVENLKTLEDIRGDSLASRTFALQLLAGFAAVGSLLTLVGIHSVLSLTVASRRRELAIRSAVGAQQSDIRNLIFVEGFRLIAGGVVAGIAAALILARVLSSFLFEVKPGDPLTLAGVALLFVAVAMLACWAPTRRAAKVDPVEALRYD